jgi:glucokinase
MSLALGIDIGGSSVKSAIVSAEDNERKLITSGLWPLSPSRTIAEATDLIDEITRDAAARFGAVDAVGVGLPGIFDEATGAPLLLPNFPSEWHNFPLRQHLENRLDCRVKFINDAKAFSMAESRLGAGTGLRSVACVALGTGVGGGVMIDGRLWRGSGTAGEFGHITVAVDGPLCGCGNYGCVEAFAGADAIAMNAGQASAREALEAAAAGDVRASKAIDLAVVSLGAALANVFVVFAPELFVIGGGLGQSLDQIVVPLTKEISRRVHVAPQERIRVAPAQLGRNAGAIGAALFAHSQNQGES